MDMTIRSGAVDAPSAKAAARNVKQRLASLGHDISLNHAYEAIAASFGHPTWAVMKARLESATAAVAPPPATVRPFPLGPLGWEKFALGETNPTSLFFGPANARRDYVISSLCDDWMRRSMNGMRRYLRTIISRKTKGSGGLFPLAADVGHIEDYTHVRISKDMSQTSVFDLPLGARYPTPPHRLRIIDFVCAVVETSLERRGEKLSEAEIRALAEPIPRLVDMAYELRVKETPLRFEASAIEEMGAVSPDISSLLRLSEQSTPPTWWDVSEVLGDKYLTQWAVWAQSQAVPTLEDVMRCARSADMDGVMPGHVPGRKTKDVLATALSTALRDIGCLRGSRKPPVDYRPVEVIEIDEEHSDPGTTGLMMLMAMNRYQMLVDAADADDRTRDLYKPQRLPLEDSPIRLVVSMPSAFLSGSDALRRNADLRKIFDDAVGNGREVAVFTDRIPTAASLIGASSSYFVIGSSTHDEVGPIAGVFGLNEAEADIIHDHMVGSTLVPDEGVPMLASKRRFHMTDRSAVMFGERMV